MSSLKQKRALLCAVTLLFWFSQYIYLPYLTPYMLSIKISATVVGVIVGVYGFMQLVLRIPLGISADLMKNNKFFICMGMLLAGLSPLPRILCPNVYTLFISNAMDGLASCMWVMFTILYSSYYAKEDTAQAMGTINIFFNTGIMVAYILGGIMYGRLGVDSLFITSSVVGFAGLIMALFIKRDPNSGTNVTLARLFQVMKSKHLWHVSILASFSWFLIFATVFSFTTSTAKEMGATGTQLSILSACYGVGTILGAFFIRNKASDKFGLKNIITVAFIFMAVYCAGLSLAGSLFVFYPLQFLCGLGAGCISSGLMGSAVRDVDQDKRSTAMGFYQSIYCVGMTIGPIIMGALIQFSSTFVSFGIMAVIGAGCAVLTRILLGNSQEAQLR